MKPSPNNIDSKWVQIRHLLVLFLRLDLRESRGQGGKKRRMPGMFWNLLIYLVMGFSFSAQLIAHAIPAEYCFFMLTYSMVMVAFAFLVDFHTVLFREDDYDILGHLPLTHGIYAIGVLAHLLIYLLTLTLSLMLIPSILTVIAPYYTLKQSLLFFVTSVWANLFFAGFLVMLFQVWIRLFDRIRWKQTLVYIQMIFIFILMMFYLFIARGSGFSLLSLRESLGNWVWLLPATWFSEVIVWSQPFLTYSVFTFLLGLTTVLLLVFAGILLNRQDTLMSSTAPKKKKDVVQKQKNRTNRAPLIFTIIHSSEVRAGYALARQLLKHDGQFKRAVYPLMAMPAAIILFSVFQGEVTDPLAYTTSIQNSSFLGMFLFFLTFLSHAMATLLQYTTDWQAGWIFYAAPLKMGQLMKGIRLMVVVHVLLPLYLFLGILFSMKIPVLHAWIHTLTLFQVGLLIFSFFANRLKTPPFSQKRIRGERTQRMGTLLMIAPLLAVILILQFLFYKLAYGWIMLNSLLFFLILLSETIYSKKNLKKVGKNIESFQNF